MPNIIDKIISFFKLVGFHLLLTSLISCIPSNPDISIKAQSPQKLSNTEIPHNVSDKIITATPIPGYSILKTNQQGVGYTHQDSDGNRFISGFGVIPDIVPIDIELPGVPAWVVGIPKGDGSVWVVTLDDGQVLGFFVDSHEWEQIDINPSKLSPEQPPILTTKSGQPFLLIAPTENASPFTHSVPSTWSDYSQFFINKNGELTSVGSMTEKTDPIMSIALPDARILTDDRGRLLYLSGPTDTYDHGVLGDSIEASSISLVGDPKTGEAKVVIKMPENLVIEGISPIWSDLDRDGSNEIIVTASNTQQGSQFLVYEENGQLLAEGPAIGQGYRWRHQIATAPFGPNGELELVGVRTPHLGGVVEFYQLIDEKLVIVAQLPGYTSHVIGSRNLDMAGAGDFDSDGHVELLLPNQSRSKIAAIRRMENGADEVWSVHLESPMTTNLGAVTLFSGNIALGIGQENGILRIWHP